MEEFIDTTVKDIAIAMICNDNHIYIYIYIYRYIHIYIHIYIYSHHLELDNKLLKNWSEALASVQMRNGQEVIP